MRRIAKMKFYTAWILFFLWMSIDLISSESFCGYKPPTPQSLATATARVFCDKDSEREKIIGQIREYLKGSDSIFLSEVNKRLSWVEGHCEELLVSQNKVIELLAQPATPESVKALMLAWPRLIKDLGDVQVSVMRADAVLRKSPSKIKNPNKEALPNLLFLADTASDFADYHQGLFEGYVQKKFGPNLILDSQLPPENTKELQN
jgi:hypothetical protein